MKDLIAELDRCVGAGRRVTFWLRDDDAVAVTAGLERLIALAGRWEVPVVLAVIPMLAEPELAARLGEVAQVRVALHGFAHRNHAPPGEKKQELGPHRPAATMLDELKRGRDWLEALFHTRTVPMLVPPWNRIAPDLIPHLPRLGLRYLSTFGREAPHEPTPQLLQIDCQLDIMDWRTRRSHPHGLLAARLAALVRQRAAAPAPIGILSHHLAHDEAAWRFLAALFRLTARHEAVTWGWPVTEFSECPAG
jgi:predicted deacetylase